MAPNTSWDLMRLTAEIVSNLESCEGILSVEQAEERLDELTYIVGTTDGDFYVTVWTHTSLT